MSLNVSNYVLMKISFQSKFNIANVLLENDMIIDYLEIHNRVKSKWHAHDNDAVSIFLLVRCSD